MRASGDAASVESYSPGGANRQQHRNGRLTFGRDVSHHFNCYSLLLLTTVYGRLTFQGGVESVREVALPVFVRIASSTSDGRHAVPQPANRICLSTRNEQSNRRALPRRQQQHTSPATWDYHDIFFHNHVTLTFDLVTSFPQNG